jgi:hypothetical protein
VNFTKLVAGGILGSLLLFAPAAQADEIYIDVSVNADANDITLDLFEGSPQLASVLLEYTETNGDGKNGCNLTGPASQVTFPVNVQLVSGSAPVLDKTSVTFSSCDATQTIGITASAVGVVNVSLGAPTWTSNSSVTASSWDASQAAFSVTVIDSTPVATLDAPEIANAWLSGRADNSDCKESWGTAKSKKANWHGQLLSAVAHKYQGQTFTEATKSIVESDVEQSCASGMLS